MDVEGFSYETWYNMPTNLRNYYSSRIQDIVKKKKETQNSIPKKKRSK
jgi:hypothetical protein